MRRLRMLGVVAVLVLLAAGCATLPPASPAPPPGSSEYRAAAESWEGVDGSVEVTNGKKFRDRAFVAIRDYCKGPFVIVREDKRMTVTPMSFPFPTKRVRFFFRCGEEAAPGDGSSPLNSN